MRSLSYTDLTSVYFMLCFPSNYTVFTLTIKFLYPKSNVSIQLVQVGAFPNNQWSELEKMLLPACTQIICLQI